MSSGHEEAFCAELGVQTESDASLLLPSTSVAIGPKEVISVEQGVQTVCADQFALDVFASPSTLAHSGLAISHGDPWVDDASMHSLFMTGVTPILTSGKTKWTMKKRNRLHLRSN